MFSSVTEFFTTPIRKALGGFILFCILCAIIYVIVTLFTPTSTTQTPPTQSGSGDSPNPMNEMFSPGLTGGAAPIDAAKQVANDMDIAGLIPKKNPEIDLIPDADPIKAYNDAMSSSSIRHKRIAINPDFRSSVPFVKQEPITMMYDSAEPYYRGPM
jgi:hypothetical protein